MTNHNKGAFDTTLGNELAPYMSTLHLHSLPFTTDVPEQKLYINSEHEQHINHLIHLLQSSDLVLVLSGETGSGKTTLLQQLISRNTPGLDYCQVQASEQLNPEKLLTQLTRCFELPEQLDNKTTLALLKDHANILRSNNRIPVAVIDDAHELPEESLKVLLSLQQSNRNSTPDHWHVILVSHPAFTADLMLLEDQLHFIQLNPLSLEQSRDYLNHRMHIAGFEGDSAFTDKDVNFIFQQSEGLPRRIHQLAHQVLLQKKPATSADQNPADLLNTAPTTPKRMKYILSTITIALLLGSVLFFQDDINRLIEGEMVTTATSTHQTLPLPASNTDNHQGYILFKIPDPAPARTDIKDKPKQMVKTGIITTVNTQKPAKTVSRPAPDSHKKPEVINEPTVKPVTHNPHLLSGFDHKLKQHAIYTRAWIMRQKPTNFTAQIMASSQADSLIKQASLAELSGKTAIYTIQRKGKPWYVLLFAQSPSKLAIKAAIAGLPPQLQRNRPWIRTFAAIQAEINAGKK